MKKLLFKAFLFLKAVWYSDFSENLESGKLNTGLELEFPPNEITLSLFCPVSLKIYVNQSGHLRYVGELWLVIFLDFLFAGQTFEIRKMFLDHILALFLLFFMNDHIFLIFDHFRVFVFPSSFLPFHNLFVYAFQIHGLMEPWTLSSGSISIRVLRICAQITQFSLFAQKLAI